LIAGGIGVRASFIDATSASVKGRGDAIGKTRRGGGIKILAIVDRKGLPVSTHAGHRHEVTLVPLSFDFYIIEAKPEKPIGDKAYESDAPYESLNEEGVEMIAPHRANRTLRIQDSRAVRCHQRRWLVEEYFAWLQWKRRLLARWESVTASPRGRARGPHWAR